MASTDTRPDSFICRVCHLEFRDNPSFTDEHRRAEYEELYGVPFPGTENVGKVCSECYPRVIEWARKRGFLP